MPKLYIMPILPHARPCPHAQRLTVENQHQEEIIDALVSRVDKLEEVLETMQRAQASERTWSGFFAPLGLGR